MSDAIAKHVRPLNLQSERDEIIHYLMHPEIQDSYELSTALAEKLRRMESCADLTRTWGSRFKVIPILEKRFDISRQTARQLYDDTQIVFGVTSKLTQQFWVDIVIGEIMEDKRKASLAGDHRAVASMQKNMAHVIEKLMGSIDTSIYEKINPPPIVIGYFPDKLKTPNLPSDSELDIIFKKLMKKKREKIYEDIAEDAAPVT